MKSKRLRTVQVRISPTLMEQLLHVSRVHEISDGMLCQCLITSFMEKTNNGDPCKVTPYILDYLMHASPEVKKEVVSLPTHSHTLEFLLPIKYLNIVDKVVRISLAKSTEATFRIILSYELEQAIKNFKIPQEVQQIINRVKKNHSSYEVQDE